MYHNSPYCIVCSRMSRSYYLLSMCALAGDILPFPKYAYDMLGPHARPYLALLQDHSPKERHKGNPRLVCRSHAYRNSSLSWRHPAACCGLVAGIHGHRKGRLPECNFRYSFLEQAARTKQGHVKNILLKLMINWTHSFIIVSC
jgi:hypothetical protein